VTSAGEVFPLLMLGAVQHPDAEFRKELKRVIVEWVDSLRPRYAEHDVVAALRECTGTVLEPFSLTEEDEEIASILLRVAFSEAVDKTRFRIVSRDTLGISGGCVVTKNLNHYYVERYARGYRRKPQTGYWSFAPRNVPVGAVESIGQSARNVSKLATTLRATIKGNDSGYSVDIKGVNLESLRWPETARLASQLQKHSVLGEGKESLDAIGLRAQVGKGGISLIPASPEATMRLTAHLLSESLVVLDPGAANEGRYKIYLRLALPDEEEKQLKTLVSVTTGYFQEWVNIEIEQAPVLSESQQLKIARWLMPHDSWVDPRFLEVV
jgi:hypothetical protein